MIALVNQVYRALKAVRRRLLRLLREGLRRIGAGSVRLGAPSGVFRALDHSEDVAIVVPGQTLRPASPDSLRVLCRFEQNGRQPWPIFWKKFSEARLVGKSLAVLRKDKRVLSENLFAANDYQHDPSYNYFYLPQATRLSGAWTSLLSHWCRSHDAQYANYYHWLTDVLPRLALLEYFPPETGILVPTPLKPFQQESLEILGLLERCRPTPEIHLEIEDYYFSSPTAMTGCDNPYAIRFLRERFLPAAAPLTPAFEKIYISRRGTSRQAWHEQEMIALLENGGWTVLQPENYSFREQIALFAQARAVCSLHGAGLANLVWCRKGCRVLELCPANFLNGCYEGLAAYVEADYRYLVFEADAKSQLKVDLKAFADAIKAMKV